MVLIAGLGNPGRQYEKNRHNVGFMWLDFLASQLTDSPQFAFHKAFEGILCDINNTHQGRVMLLKPQTYMNDSGIAVKKVSDYFKITADNIVIVHDDLDIKFGEFKIQKGKGPKIHNGISSVEEHLGTADFLRIRIGIDNRDLENRIQGRSYVLDNATPDEMNKLTSEVFPLIYSEFLKLWLKN